MIKIENLSKSFGNHTLYTNLSLTVEDGEILAIIGPNGCGKTTLLKIIAGLIKADSGNIENTSKKVAFVFQNDRLLPWLNVYENIKLVNNKEDKKKINEVIELTGLSGLQNYYPEQLSGGQKQRCAIARALYYSQELLLLDEAFNNLDQEIKKKLIADVKAINVASKTSIILVTHNMEEAEMLGARIVRL